MTLDSQISIVLPTYNGSRHIEQSIQSCLRQTYRQWQLVIVDDASTDNTPDIIARYVSSDARIWSVRHGTNRKLPAALNTGFARARGEYFTWTSDDNYYRPDALMTMLAALEEHPEVDVVYSDFSYVDSDDQFINRVEVKSPRELIKGNCIGPSFLIRSNVKEVIGPYAEDLFLAEDYDYWLRVSIHFNMKPLHEDLYCYRAHQNRLTSRNIDRAHRVTERALARNLPSMKWVAPSEKSEAYILFAKSPRPDGDSKILMESSLLFPPLCWDIFSQGRNETLSKSYEEKRFPLKETWI
jgi:glycosyltransferase involved in cell wall biosynthesis